MAAFKKQGSDVAEQGMDAAKAKALAMLDEHGGAMADQAADKVEEQKKEIEVQRQPIIIFEPAPLIQLR